jgi:hypothetical protein
MENMIDTSNNNIIAVDLSDNNILTITVTSSDNEQLAVFIVEPETPSRIVTVHRSNLHYLELNGGMGYSRFQN